MPLDSELPQRLKFSICEAIAVETPFTTKEVEIVFQILGSFDGVILAVVYAAENGVALDVAVSAIVAARGRAGAPPVLH
jgi:hypothetical protein